MNSRKPEVQAAYEHFKLTYTGLCPFCDVQDRNPDQIVESTDSMRIIRNDFPYQSWDGFEVGDHVMLVPLRHLGSFDSFDEQEAAGFFDLLKKYEGNHYSIYSRAPSNTARTVAHLHTHLIKPARY